MGVQLGKMTLRSLFSKPETVCYPFETKPQPKGLKGHIVNDITLCIFCGMCQRSCPSDAIVVDRKAGTWQIDHFRCVQCNSCVRACPKSCLTMDPNYPKPARSKTVELLNKPEPTPEEIAAKEAEKKAKVEAAMKAKAERQKSE